MNAFADVMFSLLLGWLRGFIGEIWALVTSGAGEGFLSWLGGNWLWIVLIVCVIGTALDYAVWFARWRPDRLWRARLDALRARGRGEGRRARKFRQGYQEGIQMDWLDPADAPAQGGYAPDGYDPQAAYSQSAQGGYTPGGYDPQAAYEKAAPSGYAPGGYDPQAAYSQSAQGGYTPGGYDPQAAYGKAAPAPAYDESAYRPPVSAEEYGTDAGTPGRRRRADRRAAGARRITGRLKRDDDEDERMIDGLPPLVDKEQAYHTPVYPGAPASANAPGAPWEDPDDDIG